MGIVGLLAAAAFAWSAAPASACIIAPRPVETYWSEPPKQLEPNEVVLEIQYLGYWEVRVVPREGRVVITSCGYGGIIRYRVTRVLHGEFTDSEIYLSGGSGGIVGEDRNGVGRHIVVGRLGPPFRSGRYIDDDFTISGPHPIQLTTIPLFQIRPPTP